MTFLHPPHVSEAPYDLSLIIPCYNEARILEDNVREVIDALSGTSYRWELILIDDKSHDATSRLLRRLTAVYPHVRAVYHERNIGRGATVSEGFVLARGTYVGFIDIDLEIQARYIPVMMQALISGRHDVALAWRQYGIPSSGYDLFRKGLSLGYRWLVRRYLKLPYQDTEAGCKFFRTDRVRPLLAHTTHSGWFWDTEIMTLAFRAGLRVAQIPCQFVRQSRRPSTVKPFRDSLRYIRALRAFKAHLDIST